MGNAPLGAGSPGHATCTDNWARAWPDVPQSHHPICFPQPRLRALSGTPRSCLPFRDPRKSPWGQEKPAHGSLPRLSRDARTDGVLLRLPLLPNCQCDHRPPGRSGLTYLQERTQVGMTDTFPWDQRGPGTRGELALERPPRLGRATRLTHSFLLYLALDWANGL